MSQRIERPFDYKEGYIHDFISMDAFNSVFTIESENKDET